MIREKNNSGKLKSLAIAGAIVLGSGLLAISFGNRNKMVVPVYRATRVIDGDTFETKEKQWIRISGINSPEKGFCGYENAKKVLEK